MRIIPWSDEFDEIFSNFRFAVSVCVPQAKDLFARRDVDPFAERPQAHRVRGAFVICRDPVSTPIAVRVMEDANAIVLRTCVVVRREVRVRLDDQQPPSMIVGASHRRYDLRMFGNKRELQSLVKNGGFASRELAEYTCDRRYRQQINSEQYGTPITFCCVLACIWPA